MRILLLGCQKIAVDVIDFITQTDHELVGVVTHDEERDRMFSNMSVAEFCFVKGIPTVRFDKKIDTYMLSQLNPDIIFSIYYRKILPKEIINLPKMGCINIHPSLLPRNRGPNPTYWNVRRGDMWAGTTLHYIDEGMDTGDIIAQTAVEVGDRTGFELNDYMMQMGLKLFKNNFADIMAGRNKRTVQDSRKATCNTKFTNNLRYIDWCQPAEKIVSHVRAHAAPYGRSITTLGKDTVYFDKLSVIDDVPRPSPGPGSFQHTNRGLIIQTHTSPVIAQAGDWGADSDAAQKIVFKERGRFKSGVPE